LVTGPSAGAGWKGLTKLSYQSTIWSLALRAVDGPAQSDAANATQLTHNTAAVSSRMIWRKNVFKS
jgi:hypothetical protein